MTDLPKTMSNELREIAVELASYANVLEKEPAHECWKASAFRLFQDRVNLRMDRLYRQLLRHAEIEKEEHK